MFERFWFCSYKCVKGRGGIGKWGSISDGSGIWMGLGVLAGAIAGATDVGESGGLWAATLGFYNFS